MASSPRDVTRVLIDWTNGHPEVLAQLMPVVYDELRQLARRYLRRERPDHTLQATALVHEAYLRLVNQKDAHWQNRVHFFSIAAEAIRRILVEHARTHAAAKRGGADPKLSLDEALGLPETRAVDLVALDDALTGLAALNPQQSRIVELRFFGGLTIEETAEALGVSPITISREWGLAKAWLYHELRKGT